MILRFFFLLTFFGFVSCNKEHRSEGETAGATSITIQTKGSKIVLDTLESVHIRRGVPTELTLVFSKGDRDRVQEFFRLSETSFTILLNNEPFYESKQTRNKVNHSLGFNVESVSDGEFLVLSKLTTDLFQLYRPVNELSQSVEDTLNRVFIEDPGE